MDLTLPFKVQESVPVSSDERLQAQNVSCISFSLPLAEIETLRPNAHFEAVRCKWRAEANVIRHTNKSLSCNLVRNLWPDGIYSFASLLSQLCCQVKWGYGGFMAFHHYTQTKNHDASEGFFRSYPHSAFATNSNNNNDNRMTRRHKKESR